MHIPDGFLSTPVWAALAAASAPSIVFMARRAQSEVEEGRIPLLGVMGAFVFAAQMINFPVGPGTTGHLMGAALLAFTLGPAAASVVMTAILAIQALVFQDGGILALGANAFNMAVAGVVAGYLPFHFWGGGARRKLSIFFGAAISVFVSAGLALVELRLSGVPVPAVVAGLSLALFAVNAILEGGITLAVLQALEVMQPGWVRKPVGSGRRVLGFVGMAALLLAVVGVLFAAGDPDGLEKLAEDLGIASKARALVQTPLADYETAVPGGQWMRKATAGLAGLALVFGACLLFGRALSRRSR
jgi:cobalt/nickel transport system permease protein